MYYKLIHKYKKHVICFADESEIELLKKSRFLNLYKSEQITETEYLASKKDAKKYKKKVVQMPELVKDVIKELDKETFEKDTSKDETTIKS